MYHLYRRTCGWILRYAYRTLWREYVDWGCSGPGCIYGNVWCGSNFQGIFVIIREKKIWICGDVEMIKKYKIGFDIWGLIIFIIIMIPNFIWFAVPAPNDILRGESITETVDVIASICQVLMVISFYPWLWPLIREKTRERKSGNNL